MRKLLQSEENKGFIFLIIFLLFAIAVMALLLVNYDSNGEEYKVSVIVNNARSSRWDNLRAGIQLALADKNVDINFVTSDVYGNINIEKQLVEKEIKNGADALIVELCTSADTQEIIRSASDKVPIAFVETSAEAPKSTGKSIGFYTADNMQLGRDLASLVFEQNKDGNMTIAVLAGNQEMNSMIDRLSGFDEIMGEYGLKDFIVYEGSEINFEESFNQKELIPDIIVALDSELMENAVTWKKTNENNEYGKVRIYGIAASNANLKDLDNGYIESVIFVNDYEMGYMAATGLMEKLKSPGSDLEDGTSSYIVADREGMFDSENQMILFPTNYLIK
ncbi:MAG: substrate-binding domain-containing protein [Butyrivibrio sp.]|nr:substrate-binding domain-containing protein [Butyrivibrio sp.]